MKVPPIALSAFLAAVSFAAEESGGRSPPPAETPKTADGLYDLGKRLFEEYAPDEIKSEYDFISPHQWDALTDRLQRALQSGSLEELAACAPAARAALLVLSSSPAASDLTDWLTERLDLAEAADELTHPSTPVPTPTPRPRATKPDKDIAPLPLARGSTGVPHFDLWRKRLGERPAPPRAGELMPGLKAAFSTEGIPPALAWIVEVESSFNPNARSPAGAKGLFQLMPATAESLGLRTLLPDERTHPLKSAQAAARYLRKLHERFADWPLVLAAYNAGEGRVGRALSARDGRTFASVSPDLPSETQLYVPKVLATIMLREGISPAQLGTPRPRS